MPDVVTKRLLINEFNFRIMKSNKIIGFIFVIFSTIGVTLNAQAQSGENNFCPENPNSNLLYLAPVLFDENTKEARVKLGIKNYLIEEYAFEPDSTLISSVEEYWRSKSIIIVSEEKDCKFIEEVLNNTNIESKLPTNSDVKRLYFKIEDKFMVIFLYDCGTGCIKVGGERLPVYIIDEDDKVHELTRI